MKSRAMSLTQSEQHGDATLANPEAARGKLQSMYNPAEEGAWHGPVLSGYGIHLVYIHAGIQSEPPAFALVKERVIQGWQVQRRIDFMEKYEVVIEEPAEAVASGLATVAL
jgi:hypothetical protein